MKQFRRYHFPPLAHVRTTSPAAAGAHDGEEQDWQGAVADGYRQGQQDGYEGGFEAARAEG